MPVLTNIRVEQALAKGDPAETLPAWTYNNDESFRLEIEHIFKRTWQLVAHVSELPRPGDYATFEIGSERIFAIRGEEGEIRAFHNVCRHRASLLVKGVTGHCDRFVACPYHGWVYGFDGKLRAAPGARSFAGLKTDEIRLPEVELEIFQGFIFVRLGGDGPSVAEMLAPCRAELAHYRMDEAVPTAPPWRDEAGVDWKNVWDNFLEGYHVPAGHPGLHRLFGNNYRVELAGNGVARQVSWLKDELSSNWSERHYQKLLPEAEHLPPELRRSWNYYSLFPNVAFDIYPDQIEFFQVIPTGPGESFVQGRCYGLADERREMRAARYLNRRINIQVYVEDKELTQGVQAGLESESYDVGLLSEKELCVQQFHDDVRRALPVARLRKAPEPGGVAARNEKMREMGSAA